jgi:hypothetical protein
MEAGMAAYVISAYCAGAVGAPCGVTGTGRHALWQDCT